MSSKKVPARKGKAKMFGKIPMKPEKIGRIKRSAAQMMSKKD